MVAVLSLIHIFVFKFAPFTIYSNAVMFNSFALSLDDHIWTSLQVGNLDEKNTEKIPGGTTFEESISLLIYDLPNDKVDIFFSTVLLYIYIVC